MLGKLLASVGSRHIHCVVSSPTQLINSAGFGSNTMERAELLFAKYDIYSAVRNAPAVLSKAIDELPDQNLFAGDQTKLVDELVAEHLIRVPVLDLEAISPTQREVQIDVSRDPM